MASPNPILHGVRDLSLEIYWWHHMFVVGPVLIFSLLNNWITACAATTIAVFLISFASSKVTSFFSKNFR